MKRMLWKAAKWAIFLIALFSLLDALKRLLDLSHYLAGGVGAVLLLIGYAAGHSDAMLEARKQKGGEA